VCVCVYVQGSIPLNALISPYTHCATMAMDLSTRHARVPHHLHPTLSDSLLSSPLHTYELHIPGLEACVCV